MIKNKFKILVIDDEDSFRQTIKLCLEDNGAEILTAANGEEGLSLFNSESPDLVITDYKMPQIDGMEVIRRLKKINTNVPIIMLTAYDDVVNTIEAMRLGAHDFILKPFNVNSLKTLIKGILTHRSTNDDTIEIKVDSLDISPEKCFIGKTPAIREIIKNIGIVSNNRTNILIEGENGTGKEVLARMIHSFGITKNHPFIGVNCTALSPSLFESELFGHEKGSFTGAYKVHKGKFEQAGHGTLFLDEVSEIPMDLQVKFLRVLQEKEFERVGGEKSIPFMARLTAATNQNLPNLIKQNKFRLDLYHRLKIIHFRIPPLRERKEDIPALTISLLTKINKELNKNVVRIPYSVMEILKQRQWYGNVRELENTLRRAVVLAKGDTIHEEYLKFDETHENVSLSSNLLSLAEVEKKHIEYVLKQVNWKKQKACEILGITKPTLLKKIKEYNLHPEDSISPN